MTVNPRCRQHSDTEEGATKQPAPASALLTFSGRNRAVVSLPGAGRQEHVRWFGERGEPFPGPEFDANYEFLRNFPEHLNFTIHSLLLPLRSGAITDAQWANVASWQACVAPTVALRRRPFSLFPPEVGPFVTSLTITPTSTDCPFIRWCGSRMPRNHLWRMVQGSGEKVEALRFVTSPSCLKRTDFQF